MAAELPRPGVEIIQVFRSVSPTVITPTLVPCVVGVGKQIVDVLETSSSGGSQLNSQALIALPGSFVAAPGTGSPAKYSGLDGLHLDLSFNGGPAVVVLFSDPTSAGLGPTAIVAQIAAALTAAGVTGLRAETVGSDRFRVRTLGTGEFQTVLTASTSSAAVLSAFKLGHDKLYAGTNAYDGHILEVSHANFPDPRNNLSQLAIEDDNTRVFLAVGGTGLQEVTRTRSFLRQGNTNAAAVLTGTVDITGLTFPDDVEGLALTITVNGTAVLVTFGTPADEAAFLAEINAAILAAMGSAAALASLAPTTNYLVLTTALFSGLATLQVDDGTLAVTVIGYTNGQHSAGTSAVEAVDDGNGDALTPILKFPGQNFTTAAGAAAIVGTVVLTGGALTALQSKTIILSDGKQKQSITFPASLANAAAVAAAIDAVMGATAGGGLVVSVDGGSHIVLTSIALGQEGMVRVEGYGVAGASDGAVLLGVITVSATYPRIARGNPFPPRSGDELSVDGQYLAKITNVAPGGTVDELKIDHQIPIDAGYGKSFYIVATSLAGAATATRPSSDLIIESDGTAELKAELLRDTQGLPVLASANVYLSYMAVREDITALASNPALLKFNNTSDLTASLAPVTTDNPLALGLYFALLNAPGTQVVGIGVDAVSDDAPFGTVEAFTRAAEFLETFEVYGIAPLTHDQTVAQVFNTHVTVMSDPANKGERIAVVNLSKPTAKLDTLVSSGTNGNTSGSSGLIFDTGVASLPALLLNAGIDPTTTIPVEDGVFLDIASDAKHYSVTSISGGVVTVKVSGFAPGENDDGFYSTTALNVPPLPAQLISEAFAVRIRGASLVTSAGTPDKQGIAETYAGMAGTFQNRRLWNIVPDQCGATLEGVEQVIDGFYMAAAVVGMIAQQKPQQSFTNFPMTGFTRVIGANDFFSEKQLNIIAAGGNYIVVQDVQGAPLTSRMALTTDMTSIETRTDSITKVVDFTAKFLRRGLKNFIGRFNISQGLLDSLGHVISGLLSFLQESGVLIGSHLNNIIQDESAPDTVLVDITLDVPYPCNYIRLTLVI